MSQQEESPSTDYPLGRGYGHDYMRGGEVFGGYGYAQREEYELPRGELTRGPGAPEGGASGGGIAGTPDGGAGSGDSSGTG
jgi:hypothetical protein